MSTPTTDQIKLKAIRVLCEKQIHGTNCGCAVCTIKATILIILNDGKVEKEKK